MTVGGRVEIRYRPAIDVEEAHDLVDVQELLLVLDQEDGPVRVAEVGRKRLPPPEDDESSPNWCYVRRVVDSREEVDDLLGDWSYETQTQGTRHQSATRLAAQGRWRLEGEGRDTRLSLEVSREADDEQLLDQLHVEPDATYVVAVKNPRARGQSMLGDDERADYPDELQAAFDGNRWSGADPVELLDQEGAEFLLVPAGRSGG